MAWHLCSLRSRHFCLFFIPYEASQLAQALSNKTVSYADKSLRSRLKIARLFHKKSRLLSKSPMRSSISQWPLTVLATRVSHYIVNNRRCYISLRIRLLFSKIPHAHNYYGSLIPWMDLWCWRYKVNLSLANFRVHFEPPIASQNVTKVPFLLTCLLTTWPQNGSLSPITIKSDT